MPTWTLITDRTAGDVMRFKEARDNLLAAGAYPTLQLLQRYNETMQRAVYTNQDFERISTAIADIAALILSKRPTWGVTVSPRLSWPVNAIPTAAERQQILDDANNLRSWFSPSPAFPEWIPEPPTHWRYFTFADANLLEKILQMVYDRAQALGL
jgi:hypothetical protein